MKIVLFYDANLYVGYIAQKSKLSFIIQNKGVEVNISGIRTPLMGVALKIKNAKKIAREGNYLMFHIIPETAHELLDTLKVLLPDHGVEMPPGVYYPLLDCEKCSRRTRHLFSRKEHRTYQYIKNDHLSHKQLEDRERSNSMILSLYRCNVCGYERGWGNE